ncbi:MAG: hypothetical protein LKE33_01860 [Acidaminococcus sp.]|jgi:hypothetical protein|nr:hypothetical protein [Acidaminococcus sp.]
MALKDADGKTVKDIVKEKEVQKQKSQLEELNHLNQQIQVMNQKIERMENLIQKQDNAATVNANDISRTIKTTADALINLLKYIILFCFATSIISFFCLFVLNSRSKDVMQELNIINSILKNERVFWYDEENRQLYLETKERIEQQK